MEPEGSSPPSCPYRELDQLVQCPNMFFVADFPKDMSNSEPFSIV
jgi:hypothetical protein